MAWAVAARGSVSTSLLRRLADSDSGVELLRDLHASLLPPLPSTDDGAAAAAASAAADASAPLSDGEVVRERARS